MRCVWLLTLLMMSSSFLFGQDENTQILQAKGKYGKYYVVLEAEIAKVYSLGTHYHPKAGFLGYSIRSLDTLSSVSDGTYTHKYSKIVTENGKIYLLLEHTHQKNKSEKLVLETKQTIEEYHQNLNNAYYLDSFFNLYKELGMVYPLSHLDDFVIWKDWEKIQNKTREHTQFKGFIDKQLRIAKDSIIKEQENYERLNNYIIENLDKVDYTVLKDSIALLPKDYKSSFKYFDSVVMEVAKQKPNYFFKLAEDFPKSEDFIFMRVDNDKNLIQKLKATEANAEIKNRFVKHCKLTNRMKYLDKFSYLGSAALLVLLIF